MSQAQETHTHAQLGQLVPGKNPRRYFDPKKHAEFQASIEANGIVSPLLVRPLEGGKFEIIAGERRFRAASAVFPSDHLVPVLVRDVSDEEAARLALVENVDREPMTAVEEAEAADKIVVECEGDLKKAADRLGWELPKLRKRLSLMHCHKSVRDALEAKQIDVGHAELLAAAPMDKQESALPHVIERGFTIEQLKAELLRKARKLDEAIFDRAGCVACPHNSNVQADLFSTSVGRGNCTNPPCYQQKTEDHVDAQATGLRETYAKVIVLKIDTKPVVTPLLVDGAAGVGAAQAEACKTCESYGATVSALPGNEGNVAEPLCFNLVCNAEKVRAANPPAPAPEPVEPLAKARDSEQSTAKASSRASSTPAKSTKAKVPQAPTKVDPKSLRQALLDYRRTQWNGALMKIGVTKSPAKVRQLLILMVVAGEVSAVDAHAYRDAMAKKAAKATVYLDLKTSRGAEAVTTAQEFVLAADDAAIDKFVGGIVSCSAEKLQAETLKELLVASGTAIAEFWKPDAAFWALLTKSEIDAVGTEIGLAAHLGEKWKPLLAKKKAEIEAAIAAVDFDMSGKVPSFMGWQ